jgi:vacuolar protein sorting-associated protein 53
LEEKIREKINEEYKEKVTFQVERDLFVSYVTLSLAYLYNRLNPNHVAISVISSAITLLLTHLESTTDPFFTQMSRTSYLLHTQVSGPSAWMGEMVRGIEGVVGVVKGAVEGKKYVRNFLDKCSR